MTNHPIPDIAARAPIPAERPQPSRTRGTQRGRHPWQSLSGVVAKYLVRLWFTVMSRVAPALAERQAANLFLTPRRRAAREPVVPGLTARRHTFHAAGHRIAGWSWGDGPTVLLVHGWSGLGADMTALAGAFASAGFRAVAIDLPAHGQSSGRRTSMPEWIAVLLALGEQLGEGEDGMLHAIVAHSLGAAATVLALEAGLSARGAVLLAPARSPAPFIERVRRFIGLPAERAAGMERHIVQQVGRELAFFDADRAAAALQLPGLILHDPDDPEIPWADAELIACTWRGSRLVAAEGEGHYRILRSPRIIERVMEFALTHG